MIRFPALITAGALGAALLVGTQAVHGADAYSGSDYLAGQLLSPCQEADNDARWGEAAETECEQYILGFIDAMSRLGREGGTPLACLPAQNTADEVRWAFMRWVHASYSERRAMAAADALLATLQENFKCP